MAIALPLALAVVALLGSAAAPARAVPSDPRLVDVESWAFAIGNHTLDGNAATVGARYAPFDLVVVDGEEARADEIAAMRAGGSVVLGYLSVGTVESWRSWYGRAKRYRLEAWKDWKDEWFANVNRPGLRRLLARRIAPALLDKGFDGLFLDNTDMIESHRSRTPGMRKLVGALGALSDLRGTLLFAQNGAGVIGPMLANYDGWNREDVSWSYDFDHGRYQAQRPAAVAQAQAELREIAVAGLLVTTTDYVAEGDMPAALESVANGCAAGALPYVSDIGLKRVPAQPFLCP
jgi:uncharacterized protein (TIGR01370 family)